MFDRFVEEEIGQIVELSSEASWLNTEMAVHHLNPHLESEVFDYLPRLRSPNVVDGGAEGDRVVFVEVLNQRERQETLFDHFVRVRVGAIGGDGKSVLETVDDAAEVHRHLAAHEPNEPGPVVTIVFEHSIDEEAVEEPLDSNERVREAISESLVQFVDSLFGSVVIVVTVAVAVAQKMNSFETFRELYRGGSGVDTSAEHQCNFVFANSWEAGSSEVGKGTANQGDYIRSWAEWLLCRTQEVRQDWKAITKGHALFEIPDLASNRPSNRHCGSTPALRSQSSKVVRGPASC